VRPDANDRRTVQEVTVTARQTDTRHLLRRAAAVAAVLALGMGPASSALAAQPTPPSDQVVQGAKAAENLAAQSVASIEVELARLGTVSDQAMISVQAAAETYLGASERLVTAEGQATAAQASVAGAQADLEAARQEVTAIALQAYRSGGSMGVLEAVLSSDGYQEVVARTAAYQQFGARADAAVQRFHASRIVADALTRRAQAAAEASKAAAVEADSALQAAQQAQTDAAQQVAAGEARRTELIAVLATRHNTTAQLERQRQDAADAEQRRRADAAAHAAHTATPPAHAPATKPPDPVLVGNTPPSPAPGTPAPTPTSVSTPPTTPPTGPASNDLGTGTSRGSAAQGQAAVAWALTQTGLPYLLGGTGPDAYDCSGLTSVAWATQGIPITRTSRSQYTRVLKITYQELRPGDLVFWANDVTNPDSIYHVAMWIGGGKIVEATHPGKLSQVSAMRWSGAMPYAGRP
jgi:cell wall-associated NlpC family hydrolase